MLMLKYAQNTPFVKVSHGKVTKVGETKEETQISKGLTRSK
jgi:hypothetical protein